MAGDKALQLGVVVGGLGIGHEFADGNERGLVRDFHEGQPPAVRFRNEGGGHGFVGQPGAETDADCSRALDLAHKAALFSGPVEPEPGGQDQLAAVEEALGILLLGHGHPADIFVPGGFREAGFAEPK
ncbi:hypothetical protein AHiyo1_00870 [Arthrobacter sp. Hiyo1]|nr:hypothetical protein AHiyo1_00870 [Arthrobacter sp. Hiyo1]